MSLLLYLSVDTQNWHNLDLLDNLDKPVRPIGPIKKTDQTGQNNIAKLSIGLYHYIDLVEMIAMAI